MSHLVGVCTCLAPGSKYCEFYFKGVIRYFDVITSIVSFLWAYTTAARDVTGNEFVPRMT